MFGSDTIEVVIGLVFVFFIVSLLCSAVAEWISRFLAMRAKTLKDGIKKMLDDDNLKQTILNHPLVKGLSPKPKKGEEKPGKEKPGPSELPARIFSAVLIDAVMNGDDISQKSFDSLKDQISKTSIGDNAKKALITLLAMAKSKTSKWEDTIKEFRKSLENWFDDSMDRVSGWYKRKTQIIILVIAFCICLGGNIDTFVVANSLYEDPTLRESVVAAAEKQAEQQVSENKSITEIRQSLEGLELPIGWSSTDSEEPNRAPGDFGGWIIKLLGILVTALAVSLGAPFWFDLLNKLVNLRSSGKKPKQESEEKAASEKP